MKRWLALLPIVVLVALAVFLMTQMDRMAGIPPPGRPIAPTPWSASRSRKRRSCPFWSTARRATTFWT